MGEVSGQVLEIRNLHTLRRAIIGTVGRYLEEIPEKELECCWCETGRAGWYHCVRQDTEEG